MLTNEQLRDLEINPSTAKAAFEMVSLRLEDTIAHRRNIEARALNLMKAFISLGLAVIGFGAALQKIAPTTTELSHFMLGASPLFFAAAFCVGAIWDRKHGSLGSDAGWYMRPGVIDGDEREEAYICACITNSYSKRTAQSMKSNLVAIKWIRASLIAAIATPLALALALLGCPV